MVVKKKEGKDMASPAFNKDKKSHRNIRSQMVFGATRGYLKLY